MRQSLDEVMPVRRKKRVVLFFWTLAACFILAGAAGAAYLLFGPVTPVEQVAVNATNLLETESKTLPSGDEQPADAIPATAEIIELSEEQPTVQASNPAIHKPVPARTAKAITTVSAIHHQEYNNSIPGGASTATVQALDPILKSSTETIIPVTPGTLLLPVVPRTEVLQSRYTLLDIAPVNPKTRHPWELNLLSGVGYRFSNQQKGVNAGFQFATKLSKRWWMVSGYLYDLRRTNIYLPTPLFNSTLDPRGVQTTVTELNKDAGPYSLSAFELNAQAAERYLSGAPIYQHTHQFYLGARYQLFSRLEWQSAIGVGLTNNPGTGYQGQPVFQWNNQLQWRCFRKGRIYAGWQQPLNYAFFKNEMKNLPAGELSMGLQWSIFAP